MRIEANLTSELDGKFVKVKWKNDKLIRQLNETRDQLVEGNRRIEKDEDLSPEEAEEQRLELLAQFYHDQSDIMFEFEKGCPEKEWFGRDDFPTGQFEFLRQVFTNPQIQT